MGTFLASHSTGRESRQHARLEGVYAEYVEQVTKTIARMRSLARRTDLESGQPSVNAGGQLGLVVAKMHLYASPQVLEQIKGLGRSLDDAIALSNSPTRSIVRASTAGSIASMPR